MISISQAQELLKIATLLEGKKLALEDEKVKIQKDVEKSKKWIQKQPDYLRFLKQLQTILHQKNISAFGQLLSYFVKDVLKKDKDIIFDLYTYHNLPALKIEASNDGCKEDIVAGSGGSIANIVSTGLRLIALSRLSHRKFIVLDEPDCWLKPDHIPIFAKIVGEISQKLKIQTILISHHTWHYFKNYAKVIELKSDGKNLFCETVHEQQREIPFDLNYISKIELMDFMSHYHTTYELDPYLTCLIGENDLGKSVLGSALKSVAYNDSSDSFIKHYRDKAKVLIALSNGNQILWERTKETTQDFPQKVKYTLIKKNESPISEFNSESTPKFIEKELNILLTEDIDVHIGNQKQPVFLLSSDIKPAERAKILSLGKESLYIQKMMESIKSKAKVYNKTIKDGEIKFALITKQISSLDGIENIALKAQKTIDDLQNIERQQIKSKEMKETIELVKEAQSIADLKTISTDFKQPQINDTSFIKDDISLFHKLSEVISITPINTNFKAPSIQNTEEAKDLLKETNINFKISQIPLIKISDLSAYKIKATTEFHNDIHKVKKLKEVSNISKIEIKHEQINPKLKSSGEGFELLQSITETQETLTDLNNKKEHLQKWEVVLTNEMDEFIKENPTCPTCQQPLSTSHFHIGINK